MYLKLPWMKAFPVDLDDLQKMEVAPLTMKRLLDTSLLDDLVREREREREREIEVVDLNVAARFWQKIIAKDLWYEEVSIGGEEIRFRITPDKSAYMSFGTENGGSLPVQLRDLEALEEGLLAAIAVLPP